MVGEPLQLFFPGLLSQNKNSSLISKQCKIARRSEPMDSLSGGLYFALLDCRENE